MAREPTLTPEKTTPIDLLVIPHTAIYVLTNPFVIVMKVT